ncbi:MAG: CAAX prenyl protease-related protein [Planctomycetes bacterium]|nr:CAAX prenyl protease-related protein [Planctomycetota bacterium]
MADTTGVSSKNEGPRETQAEKLPVGWLSKWPWVTFLLPMVVYMLMGTLEPGPPPVPEASDGVTDEATAEFDRQLEEAFGDGESQSTIRYEHYPYVYTAKIALTFVTMILVWPGYRTLPWRVSGMSVVVGVVGVVLWIVLCDLQLEVRLVGPLDRFLGGILSAELAEGEQPSIGLVGFFGGGERSAYNPLEELRDLGVWAYVFLAIRFVGLALVVPVIEEFFLRGFLMRYVVHENWWQVPFGTVNRTAVIAGTAIPILMHLPSEYVASLVWFSMVTWLMVRTRSIGNCVAAHAITNFLLGVYVVVFDEWHLM